MQKYEKPSMELILLEDDIITTSNGLNNGGTGGVTGGEGYGTEGYNLDY